MYNFVYHNPTKIIFGKNTISSIGKETAQYGTTVLLVTGTSSAKTSGVYDEVIDSFSKVGLTVIEHSGVQSNPILSHVRAGIALAKKHSCTVICGVGGGSVIDSAKAIGAGAVVEHDVWKFFTGKKSVKTTLPVTCVLTLAASGSEMNSGMVVTNDDNQQKFGFANRHLYPKTSILDPETTYTVPPNYTAYGAVDAIAHVLEPYFTTQLSPASLQDRYMEGVVQTIMENCDKALLNPTNYEARSQLMWASSLALNGLASAGLGKVGFPMHLIEHSLSALYNVPHGAGLSVVIPGWMHVASQMHPTKFEQFAQRVFGLVKNPDDDLAKKGIEALKKWFDTIDSPTSLQALHVEKQDHSRIARNALALAKVWRMREYEEKTIEEILLFCD